MSKLEIMSNNLIPLQFIPSKLLHLESLELELIPFHPVTSFNYV